MKTTISQISNTEICFQFKTAGHAQLHMMPVDIQASWTASECKKFRLPAGEYQFKVSGHSVAGVTLSIFVNGSLVAQRIYPPGLFNGEPFEIQVSGGYYVF